jgi:hypothetical protein
MGCRYLVQDINKLSQSFLHAISPLVPFPVLQDVIVYGPFIDKDMLL